MVVFILDQRKSLSSNKVKFSVHNKELMRNKSGRRCTMLTPPLVNYFSVNKCVAENAKDFLTFCIVRVRYGIIIVMVMMMMMMMIILL